MQPYGLHLKSNWSFQVIPQHPKLNRHCATVGLRRPTGRQKGSPTNSKYLFCPVVLTGWGTCPCSVPKSGGNAATASSTLTSAHLEELNCGVWLFMLQPKRNYWSEGYLYQVFLLFLYFLETEGHTEFYSDASSALSEYCDIPNKHLEQWITKIA